MSGPVNQTLPEPTTLAFRIRGGVQKMWIETPKDVNDAPIMDAAKQLPLKPVFVLQAVNVYYITKIVTSYSDASWRNENNSLNSGTWRSWPKGEAWCTCSWEPKTYNGADCVEINYEVYCLRGGWQTKIPEAGYAYLDGTDLRDWTTNDGSITIGKLTDTGGKAGADSDLLVTDRDTKRFISFSFLPS